MKASDMRKLMKAKKIDYKSRDVEHAAAFKKDKPRIRRRVRENVEDYYYPEFIKRATYKAKLGWGWMKLDVQKCPVWRQNPKDTDFEMRYDTEIYYLDSVMDILRKKMKADGYRVGKILKIDSGGFKQYGEMEVSWGLEKEGE